MKRRKTQTLLLLCLITGSLDAAAALLTNPGTPPGEIFQYIASGCFGDAAFKGGGMMVFWGILFHYLIAATWSFLLFILYPSFSRSLKNKYILGAIYGVMIWLIMNRLVLPLSNVPGKPLHPSIAAIIQGLAIHVLCLGLPISLTASKFYRMAFLKRTLD